MVIDPDGAILFSVLVPIDVEPWTNQSRRDRRTIREAVHLAMSTRGHFKPHADGALCVTAVSVVPQGSRGGRKDADNLVKGLLDSLEGVLYSNDYQIQCLTSRRLEYAGKRGHYIISARAVYAWTDDIVYDDRKAARILYGDRIATSRSSL